MSLNSRQKTANYRNQIGDSFSTIEIDNIFYDTRCNMSYGVRPGKTETLTIQDEDDEGNIVTFSIESPVVAEGTGVQIKHDYIQCEDGHDEVYFYHVWDWTHDLNSSLRKTINRTVRGIKFNPGGLSGETMIPPSYTSVSRDVSWEITLDKVDAFVDGIPPGKDISVYVGGTDDDKIFFKYSSNTRTVVKKDDVINGATVIKVLNFSETVENNINKDTICYAELSGGGNFTADQTYTASLSGGSIIVVAGRGIKTRSAAVGIYVERDHKEIDLAPIFYKNETDANCQRQIDSDDDADYVKGSLTLSNGDKPFKDKWFVYFPKSDIAKFITTVTNSFFRVYPEKNQLKKWISKTNLNKLELQQLIIAEMKDLFGDAKVLEFLDGCFNPILPFVSQSYRPYDEISKVRSATTNVSSFIEDCIPSAESSTVNQVQKVYTDFKEFGRDLQQRFESNDSSIVFPESFYKLIVSNEDSMLNVINKSLETISETFNDEVLYSLPTNIAVSDGENETGIKITKTAFRDIPPKYPKIDILPENVRVDDSKFDISSSSNIITIQIYSYPRFTSSTPEITNPVFPIFGGPSEDNTFIFDVETDSNGYLLSVTAEGGTTQVTTSIGNGTTTITEPSITIGPGGTGLNQGLKPHIIWSSVSSTQSIYNKDFRFRTQEFSENTSNLSKLRGYSFKTSPVYARLTRTISSQDTIINVNSTTKFLSSGYLIIPKYVRKLEIYGINNVRSHYFYDGEEIIYYSGKTSTSFTGCERGRFGTTSSFQTSLTPYTKNPGANSVTTGYSEGINIAQYYEYDLEP
jgi:hypothetical protein